MKSQTLKHFLSDVWSREIHFVNTEIVLIFVSSSVSEAQLEKWSPLISILRIPCVLSSLWVKQNNASLIV